MMPGTKELTCLECGIVFEVSVYANAKRCPECSKARERILDAAAHRRKREPNLKATEYPCEECGSAITWDRKGRRPKRCPSCREAWTSIYERKYRQPRPPVPADKRRAYQLRHRYGIELEEWQAILDRQGGGCAGCLRSEAEVGRLFVDHDHGCCPGGRSCGRCVRGLLCRACNTALGLVGEDEAVLRSMRAYVKRAPRGAR